MRANDWKSPICANLLVQHKRSTHTGKGVAAKLLTSVPALGLRGRGHCYPAAAARAAAAPRACAQKASHIVCNVPHTDPGCPRAVNAGR